MTNLRERFATNRFVTGQDFSRADTPLILKSWALQVARKLKLSACFVTGHDFSRADTPLIRKKWALAPAMATCSRTPAPMASIPDAF
jgi:hypothetical protein